jgi:S1-C subfamily serine protease
MLEDPVTTSLGLVGVIVDAVLPGGGAEQAGLKSLEQSDQDDPNFDRITALDGEAIRSSRDLLKALGQHQPGEQVEVTFIRAGETRTVPVTLGSAR